MGLLDRFKGAVAKAKGDLEGIRKQIVALKAERARIAGEALPIEEALAKLDEYLGASISKGRPEVFGFIMPTQRPSLNIVESGEYGRPLSPFADDRLAWLFRDLIRERLAEEIGLQLARRPAGLAAAERAFELARIDGELLGLERQEEALIEEGEAAGLPIMRRPDADPRAVLNIAA